jgi:hypothetical protein
MFGNELRRIASQLYMHGLSVNFDRPHESGSSPSQRRLFRLFRRHAERQALSRVRLMKIGSIIQATRANPLAARPWRRVGVFGFAQLCALLFFSTARVPITQAPHVTSSPIKSSPEAGGPDQIQASHVSPTPVRLWRREGTFGAGRLCARFFFFFSLTLERTTGCRVASFSIAPCDRRLNRPSSAEGASPRTCRAAD